MACALVPAPAHGAACAIPSACFLGANSSSGAGVEGTSAGSYGVWGITTFNASSASAARGYGVFGQDRSTSAGRLDYGVLGTSTNGIGTGGVSKYWYGLSGVSADAAGVYGSSAATAGVYGVVTSPATATTLGNVAGVLGVNLTGGNTIAGVIGKTAGAGYGVAALSGDGARGALYASSTDGYAVTADSTVGDGVFAYSSGGGVGVYALSTGSKGVGLESVASAGATALEATATLGAPAAVITSDNKNGDTGQYIDYAAEISNSGINTGGLTVTGDNVGVFASSSGYPFYAGPLNNGVFYVDSAGDVYYRGTLTSGTPTTDGRRATMFGSQTTTPTLEDVGTARLSGGSATVAFGREFSATLDARTPYHVFLTPEGDSRGLYVSAKTSRGFTVRENQGGHSTLDFDYRVVGTASGNAGKHSAFVPAGATPGGLRFLPLPRGRATAARPLRPRPVLSL